MTYKTYKQKLTKIEYFNNWIDSNIKSLSEDIKEQIYQKYLVKCKVFNRDNFKCQQIDCKYPDSPLTMHHVKWQKNGGEHKERNCITLCKTCHKGFHRGKKDLTFINNKKLPDHMKGHTFKLNKVTEVDWKLVRKEMKTLRKNFKSVHGIHLSLDELSFLMKWLENVIDLDDSFADDSFADDSFADNDGDDTLGDDDE